MILQNLGVPFEDFSGTLEDKAVLECVRSVAEKELIKSGQRTGNSFHEGTLPVITITVLHFYLVECTILFSTPAPF